MKATPLVGCLAKRRSKNLALAGFHQFSVAAVFAGHLQRLAADLGIADLVSQALRLIGLKSIMLGLGHACTFELESRSGRKGSVAPQITVSRIRACGGLKFVLFSFTVTQNSRVIAMDADKEREIIRLWNRLRLLEREGRPTTAVLRQIQKALAEHERQAA